MASYKKWLSAAVPGRALLQTADLVALSPWDMNMWPQWGCGPCGTPVVPTVPGKSPAGFNDLSTMEPEIAAQWHPTLNGSLTPQMVTAGSHKKVWWLCAEGHVWKAAIAPEPESRGTAVRFVPEWSTENGGYAMKKMLAEVKEVMSV